MLEVIDLSFKYDKSDWLFKHVNITIRPGEIVGMYGKSGSGKTTMLKSDRRLHAAKRRCSHR